MAHNFGHRCVSKSMKGSKDADFHLVFNKTMSQKNGPMGWGPGPTKCGQHFQNMPFLQRHLQKNPHRNRKTFFFDFDNKTCWIRRGFEQLSSSSGWRVIGLQSSARKVAHAGLKGLRWANIYVSFYKVFFIFFDEVLNIGPIKFLMIS